jgi:hypothetical protein
MLLRLGRNAALAETRILLDQAEQSAIANEASTTADQHLNLADGRPLHLDVGCRRAL